MNNLLAWFASDGWSRLVLVLCHSLWQGGLIALGLGCCLRRLPAHRAAARHGVSLAALGMMVFCVLVTASILEERGKAPAYAAQPNKAALQAESGRASGGAAPGFTPSNRAKAAPKEGVRPAGREAGCHSVAAVCGGSV